MNKDNFFKRIIQLQILHNKTTAEAVDTAKNEFGDKLEASYPVEYVFRVLKEYQYVKYRNELIESVKKSESSILHEIEKPWH